MKMRFYLLTILLIFPFTVKADDARYQRIFTGFNDAYELRLKDFGSAKWSLVEKETGKELYELTGEIWSMSVFVSNNGMTVVAIDDYSDQDSKKDPEVLSFYSKGEKTKSYKLSTFMATSEFITFSVSHFHWLFNTESSYNPFTIKDKNMTLQTYELNNFVFDIESGELLSNERDKSLSNGEIYVFGKVKTLGGNNHEILVTCSIYGSIPKGTKVKFTSDKIRWDGSGFSESLVIKDGKLVDRKNIIFNACQ
jgi:hypothetical protein